MVMKVWYSSPTFICNSRNQIPQPRTIDLLLQGKDHIFESKIEMGNGCWVFGSVTIEEDSSSIPLLTWGPVFPYEMPVILSLIVFLGHNLLECADFIPRF